jgi:hypothetical protein
MRMTAHGLLVLVTLACLARHARADSHHQVVKISPIIDKKSKKTIGAKIYVILKPSGHSMARLGLLPSRADLPASGHSLKTELMNPTSAHWLHSFPDQTELTQEPRELELVVHHNDKIKGGQKYQLGSVWNNDPNARASLHVWGVEWTRGWGDPEIQLPL